MIEPTDLSFEQLRPGFDFGATIDPSELYGLAEQVGALMAQQYGIEDVMTRVPIVHENAHDIPLDEALLKFYEINPNDISLYGLVVVQRRRPDNDFADLSRTISMAEIARLTDRRAASRIRTLYPEKRELKIRASLGLLVVHKSISKLTQRLTRSETRKVFANT